MVPGPEGPVVARDRKGAPVDVFDVTDRLLVDHHRIYVVDLDGIDHDRPQLDYIQELSRDTDLWVDAGVRTAEQSIDVIVAGAQRAVLSTAYLASPKELRKASKLSTELVLEIEWQGGAVVARSPEWQGRPAASIAQEARALGVGDIILSPRGDPVDWRVVTELSRGGPTWANGSFERSEAPALKQSGAVGGIFHIDRELAEWAENAGSEAPEPSARS